MVKSESVIVNETPHGEKSQKVFVSLLWKMFFSTKSTECSCQPTSVTNVVNSQSLIVNEPSHREK